MLVIVFQDNNEEENQRSTNATGTYLEHFNEYCLLKIFEEESLSWMDLCSVAECCKRFQRISQRVFPKDLSVRGGNGRYDVASRKYLHRKDRASQSIERIFKNFGACLAEVSISPKYRHESQEPPNSLLHLVTEYICEDTLKSLKIRGLEIPAVLTVKLKTIFEQLLLLDLANVSVVDDDTTVFADLKSMIELRVEKCDAIIRGKIFSKLERFTYRSDSPIDQPLTTFIRSHPNLTKLNLSTRVHDKTDNTRILKVIVNSCKELKELSLDIGRIKPSSLRKLQSLKSLNILKLCGVKCDDFKFLSTMTELRELHLFVCRSLPGESSQFAFLAQLTTLHIQGGRISGGVDVVGMINELINLEELAVVGMWTTFVLNEETFSKIVDVVKERKNVLTLRCDFNFVLNLKSCEENKKVKLLRPDRLID